MSLTKSKGGAEVTWDDDAWRKALPKALERITLRSTADLWRLAIAVTNNAKSLCAVDTGRLRASITWTRGEDAKGPYAEIGTNVDYAPHVEYGTQHMAAQPFMRPALLFAAREWSASAA